MQSQRDAAQVLERLPPRVQDLLARGRVVDDEIRDTGQSPEISVVARGVVSREAAPHAAGTDFVAATQRWSSILQVAKYLVENLPPSREPREIIGAVQHVLRAQAPTEIDELYQKARDGQPVAMFELSRLLQKRGQPETAENWLRRSADAGYPGGLFTLGKRAWEEGRFGQAELWLRKAADTKHPDALYYLWRLCQDTGRLEEAELWLRRAAESDHGEAMFILWQQERDNGRLAEAEMWLHRAGDAGHPPAQRILAQRVSADGRPDEAAHLLRRAAAAGDTGAWSAYEVLHYEQWLQQGTPTFRPAP